MNVVILAAGIGSRLRPMTYSKPKGMVKVNGHPIIEHQIKAYIKGGIPENRINIVIGYKANVINDFISTKYPDINIIENKHFLSTNNMFSLNEFLNAKKHKSLIISNGDCIYQEEIIKKIIENENDNIVACDKGSYTAESMKITVNNNIVKNISKEICKSNAYGNSIDLYRISSKASTALKKIIKDILKEDENKWTEFALDELFKHFNFSPLDINKKKWAEIDDYNDLYNAEVKFSDFTLEDKKALIFDLDGTVYLGEKPILGTVNFIKKNLQKYQIYFITNNTSKSINEHIEKLNRLGIHTTANQVISPINSLTNYLSKHNINKVFSLGNSSFNNSLQKSIPKLVFTDDPMQCKAVVVSYDTELTYNKLKTASLLLHNQDIKYIATHEDIVCPTVEGNIPDIGTIIKTLEMTTTRKPTIILGKPNTVIISDILDKHCKSEIVMIGDRLYTDKLLADKAGISFILVLSGEAKREDVEELETPPSLIINDCSSLN